MMAIFLFVHFPLTVAGAIVGRNITAEFKPPCRTNKVPREVTIRIEYSVISYLTSIYVSRAASLFFTCHLVITKAHFDKMIADRTTRFLQIRSLMCSTGTGIPWHSSSWQASCPFRPSTSSCTISSHLSGAIKSILFLGSCSSPSLCL